MRIILVIIAMIMALVIGVFIGNSIDFTAVETPRSFDMAILANNEKLSPSDHIAESNIHVYQDNVIIDADVEWTRFENTNSMDPIIDFGANGLEKKPGGDDEILIGDIVSYYDGSNRVIHRVIEKGKDETGYYYIVKGDNNKDPDPYKLRFKDIKGVLVAIIY